MCKEGKEHTNKVGCTDHDQIQAVAAGQPLSAHTEHSRLLEKHVGVLVGQAVVQIGRGLVRSVRVGTACENGRDASRKHTYT